METSSAFSLPKNVACRLAGSAHAPWCSAVSIASVATSIVASVVAPTPWRSTTKQIVWQKSVSLGVCAAQVLERTATMARLAMSVWGPSEALTHELRAKFRQLKHVIYWKGSVAHNMASATSFHPSV